MNDWDLIKIGLEYIAYLIECKAMKVVKQGELYYLYQHDEVVQETDTLTGIYGPVHSFREAEVWIKALHHI
jgi:hypothetical protein